MPKRTPIFGKTADLFGLPRLDPAVLKAGLKACLHSTSLSRDQIADAASAALGRAVTTSMLNDWCAPGKPHLPRLDEVAAIVFVTRRPELLDALARAADLRVLTPAQAERLELVELEDERAELDDRISELRARVISRRSAS